MSAGDYRYELLEGWGELPEGWELGQTGIATDSEDRVYLFNRSSHPLIVLGPEGGFLRSWGEGVLTDAHGIYVDTHNNLYLPVKDAHVVLKYDRAGNLLMALGLRGHPSDTGWTGKLRDTVQRAAGPFNRPTDVAVSTTGEIYVSDGYGNSRVHKFTAEGELLFSWGVPSKTAPGGFHIPHGIWVHRDGRVFVADRGNNRIQIFNEDGKFLDQWTGLAHPCDIFIDGEQTVYVAELLAFLSIFSIEGECLARFPGPTNAGAHAVWVDRRGDLYINQNLEGQRLLKYRKWH